MKNVNRTYRDLGSYSDWVREIARAQPLYPMAPPGIRTRRKVRTVLGFHSGREFPNDIRAERRWTEHGIAGEEISWDVGYGPRTKAWLLRPAGVTKPLPGILALHDHGGFKYYGKEKIADDDAAPNTVLRNFRNLCYGGRPFANDLAGEGFAVLVHDVFLWGSRKFEYDEIPESDRLSGDAMRKWRAAQRASGIANDDEIDRYNTAAGYHEMTVAKYGALLGVPLAGIVAHEDRIAANYLASRADVRSGRIGCVGLSGGGMRSGLLQASCNRIRAAVVVGAMTTSEGLLDHNVTCHTWMLFPDGWARHGDWSDLVACRAPSPLLVQYDRDDPLYTPAGMRAADRRLQTHYQQAGKRSNYRGEFYPGLHKFDRTMQRRAFDWLKTQLT